MSKQKQWYELMYERLVKVAQWAKKFPLSSGEAFQKREGLKSWQEYLEEVFDQVPEEWQAKFRLLFTDPQKQDWFYAYNIEAAMIALCKKIGVSSKPFEMKKN